MMRRRSNNDEKGHTGIKIEKIKKLLIFSGKCEKTYGKRYKMMNKRPRCKSFLDCFQ
jgi:hypothetical protein